MKQQIYYVKLIDGKEFVETSRTDIYNKLKEYIQTNNKLNDRWYYPTKNQIDNMYYGKVKRPNLFFMECLKWCMCDDVFNIDVRTERENGKKYSEKYIRTLKNNHINKQIEKYKVNTNELDTSKFTDIMCC